MALYLSALLIGALGLPLAAGLWLIITSRRTVHRRHAWMMALIAAGLATLCAAGLVGLGDQDVILPTWIPTAGPMRLHIGGLGTQLAAATTATLFVSLFFTRQSRKQQPLALALQMAALSAANGAFLAGDFLLRYLALEMVGLCVGLAPLVAHRGTGLEQAKRTYLSLRLGDAGLLGAILILWHAGGTLAIGPAIAAGTELPTPTAMWAVGGLLLAVWVKSGLWPFHGWQDTATDLPPPMGAWLYGSAMPNLGLYLLYRTVPLVATTPRFRSISVILALFGLLVVYWFLPRQGRHLARPSLLSAALGAAGVIVAAIGETGLLAALILIATPIRAAMWLVATTRVRPSQAQTRARAWDRYGERGGRRPQGAEATILAVAAWSSLRFEKRIAQDGVTRLWELLFAAARWLHLHVETRIAHQGVLSAWRFLTGTAQTWYRVGERGVATGIVKGTAQSAVSISDWLRALHTGKLRVNQRWTVAALVLAVSLLVWLGW